MTQLPFTHIEITTGAANRTFITFYTNKSYKNIIDRHKPERHNIIMQQGKPCVVYIPLVRYLHVFISVTSIPDTRNNMFPPDNTHINMTVHVTKLCGSDGDVLQFLHIVNFIFACKFRYVFYIGTPFLTVTTAQWAWCTT
jgi:hypothetical protein